MEKTLVGFEVRILCMADVLLGAVVDVLGACLHIMIVACFSLCHSQTTSLYGALGGLH